MKQKIFCGIAASIIASSLAADDLMSKARKSLETLVGPSMAISSFQETDVENIYEAIEGYLSVDVSDIKIVEGDRVVEIAI